MVVTDANAMREPRVAADHPVVRLTDVQSDAAPVVFIHGLLETPSIWTFLVSLLEQHQIPAIALPLPGHFPWAIGPDQVETLLQDDHLFAQYADMIRQCYPGRAVRLVGHSTGGMIALEIARLYPDLVQAVMPIGALWSGRLDNQQSLLARITLNPWIGPWSFRKMMEWWHWDEAWFQAGLKTVVGSPEVPVVDIPLQMLADLRQSNYDTMRRLAEWVASQDVLARLDQVCAPVCVVIGNKDAVVPPLHQLQIVKALPNATAVILDSGHLPMIEARALFEKSFIVWVLQPDPYLPVQQVTAGKSIAGLVEDLSAHRFDA
ncbi:alpha/beta fold hydrolase [Pseudaestuariivita rosea]|uniref:alpha/beta fold hydrolase n=1 Tax=Pseudaestuariivita rosea TaxID=2763263 RepID=UPI001ABA1007|nr:alpha/beta hydrolase [Pseudaestuariivita rosea]